MTVVKIRFNPNELKESDEPWPAFRAGGMTLKFWALYKKRFITSNHFRSYLCNLAAYYEGCFDDDQPDVVPYTNIDEFICVLRNCGIEFGSRQEMAAWAADLWDYFSFNIQRSLTLEYMVMEPVPKHLVIDSSDIALNK